MKKKEIKNTSDLVWNETTFAEKVTDLPKAIFVWSLLYLIDEITYYNKKNYTVVSFCCL